MFLFWTWFELLLSEILTCLNYTVSAELGTLLIYFFGRLEKHFVQLDRCLYFVISFFKSGSSD